jgi:hypothetical protein
MLLFTKCLLGPNTCIAEPRRGNCEKQPYRKLPVEQRVDLLLFCVSMDAGNDATLGEMSRVEGKIAFLVCHEDGVNGPKHEERKKNIETQKCAI